jgi:hypothetical protein
MEKEIVNNNNNKVKTSAIINIILFLSILIAGAALSIILPKEQISYIEKRKLARMPHFTADSLFKGKYTQQVELYYADNFPYREPLVTLSNNVSQHFGYTDDVQVYNLSAARTVKPAPVTPVISKDNVRHDSIDLDATDTMENDAEIVKSLLINNGRAIQIFGGSKIVSAGYAAMINNYHKALGNDVKIHCLVMPSPYDFYTPNKYRSNAQNERNNIAFINSKLDSGINGVDSYTEIEAHKHEYLYFNTDHHWTGRGAYYAYRGFCKSIGVAPYELSAMERHCIPGLLGSLYWLTRDPRLHDNIDSVEYFKLPISTKATLYRTKDLQSPQKASLFFEAARGNNGYGVFLSGDYPLMKVESANKNGRKLLIIKDSYGNAISPYFALHYEELYIIDYRYFESNILNFIKEHKITDMIFLHNTFAANSRYTAKRESYLMRIKKNATDRQIPEPKSKLKAGTEGQK